MTKTLITGATGYIGRRLTDRLLGRTGYSIRLLVRNKSKVEPSILQKAEVVEGDTFNKGALLKALEEVDCAYYLIHSMGAGKDFEERDRLSAENFREACIEAGVRRLVYLGGLGVKETASRHLLSRIETGEILSARPERIQTIWFRAGVIIGSGSASFEIIFGLVQKLPIMITPRWVTTRTQPVAVEDVLSYLAAAADLDVAGNLVVDIGTDPMSFKDMMVEAARVMGLERVLVPVPVLSPKLSSYWLILFTPVPYQVAAALVEGLKSETIVLNDNALRCFPQIRPMSFDDAVSSAVEEMERHQVISRWCDSTGGAVCDVKGHDDPSGAILRDRNEISLGAVSAEHVFESICTLGGESGWLSYNMLWRIRGWIDKLFGGWGLNRGRRRGDRLRVGDALDFWKVVDVKENRRVLLLAQMKLPGKAWLEFDIREDSLVQTAHFWPHGLLGRLYWYSLLPLHGIIFRDLAKKIVEHAAKLAQGVN
jgi:uncharacterized protein YbjT (DUF2867 family)